MPTIQTNTSRRIALASIGSGILALPLCANANPIAPDTFAKGKTRTFTLNNLHTGEDFVAIASDNALQITPRLKAQFNHFMRDHYSNEVTRMDSSLITHLFTLQRELEIDHGVFEIISAYRSPKTNAMLRKRGRRVAKNSMHMSGQAIDLRLQGVKLTSLRDAALDLKAGGVGFYRTSGFLHFDTGRVRRW